MKIRMQVRIPAASACLALALLAYAPLAMAQAATRMVGAISAIDGTTLTVKTDAGVLQKVDVPPTAAIKRISPGQRDLSSAETILFRDLATGDRVLIKLDPDAAAGSQQALQIIAIKQADVAAKQQKDREDWQRRGVGGLVKSVDAASGAIVINSGAGPTAKTVTIHTTKATVLKRYAPASVKYDAAQVAPIDAIRAGDQLRARGAKNADGTEVAAEEVVSGSFRNISGTVISVDSATATILVKDLATKKQVTIHTSADTQVRKIPERMAQMLAMRLKGTTGTTGAGWGNGAAAGQRAGGAAASGGGQSSGQGAGQMSGQGGGQSSGQWAAGGQAPDPSQFLTRAPAIQISELKKDDAIMVVATESATEVNAITLLAGVEPLLQAPAVQNLLSNWSVSGSGGAEGSQ